MKKQWLSLNFILVLLGFALLPPLAFGQAPQTPLSQEVAKTTTEKLAQGKYIFHASGGCTCHTDYKHEGAKLAGGRPIAAPMGIFYSTNITPDKKTGIGAWTDDDFVRAMTEGVSPQRTHYYPIFPYTSFRNMSKSDLLALKAYLFSLPAVEQMNKPHQISLIFSFRPMIQLWKWWNIPALVDAAELLKEKNRGAYLVKAVGHCGECHTSRTLTGALTSDRALAGSQFQVEDQFAPNITFDKETGLGGWSQTDLTYFLKSGIKPDGDTVQAVMGEIIEEGLSHLSESDLQAIGLYVASLPHLKGTKKEKRDAHDKEVELFEN